MDDLRVHHAKLVKVWVAYMSAMILKFPSTCCLLMVLFNGPLCASMIVNVDFDTSGVYSGQGAHEDLGNNHWNARLLNGAPPLVTSDGQTLTTARITDLVFTGSHSRASYNNELLRDGIVNASTFTIRGLDDAESYDLYIYSTFSNYGTTFTVGDASVTIDGSPDTAPYQLDFVEGETYGRLTGLVPSGGMITVSVTKSDPSKLGTFLTGLQIVGNIPQPPPPRLHVNVDFGADPYTAGGHWNSGGANTSYQAGNLIAVDGVTTTPIGVAMLNTGMHTRSGYSNKLLRDGLITTGTGTMVIGGLDSEESYMLTLFGTFDDFSFDFTADGKTTGISGSPNASPYQENLNEGVTYATLKGVRANNQGEIEVTLLPTGSTGNSFVTGFQILSETPEKPHELGRIVCIGDSITEARATTTFGDGNWSWRYWFWENLVDFSIGHQFVGTRTSNNNGSSTYPAYKEQSFSNRHEAIWGTTALARANAAPTYLSSLSNNDETPDIAVVFLGGNDVGNTSFDVTLVRDRIKTIVDNIQGDLGNHGNPLIRIVIVSILPRFTGGTTPDARNDLFSQLNGLLSELADNETTAISEVTFLDLEPLFKDSPGLFYDGVHPNGGGEQLIGNAIFAELFSKLPPVQMSIDPINSNDELIHFQVRTHGPRMVWIEESDNLLQWGPATIPTLNPGESLQMSVSKDPLDTKKFFRAAIEEW